MNFLQFRHVSQWIALIIPTAPCTYGGFVLGVLELLLEVEGEDGLHAVVGEPLAELVTHDEEDALRVGQLLKT